jgi:hypothetical protein
MAEEASRVPGFCCAYTAGSTNWLSDDADLPTTSDVDIMVVLEEPNEGVGRRKFHYCNVLFEVSYLWQNQFQSPTRILSDYHLAPSLQSTTTIFDPLGLLAPILVSVSTEYRKRHWVQQRATNARDKVLRFLQSVNGEATLHEQVIRCLFAAGITTHILLVAGLRNPTVRARYRNVRELLVEYGHDEFQETLLNLLGSARISRERVKRHLATLSDVLDAARVAIKTPFPFASDVSDDARAITKDGILKLIEQGYHREAMFWVGIMHSRCQKILWSDAPGLLSQSYKNSFHELAWDLGLPASAAVRQRCVEIERALPQVCSLAQTIARANPEIENYG